jgi:probable HAF family extracellular repeat protein
VLSLSCLYLKKENKMKILKISTIPILIMLFLSMLMMGFNNNQYTITDLGTLGGSYSGSSAINERGQIVGNSPTASGDSHAFLWDKGTMIDLGTLGGNYSSARTLNNRGQVVGISSTASGTSKYRYHFFLWEKNTMIDLGLDESDVDPGLMDINERSQIIGKYEGDEGDEAFLWETGSVTILEKLGGDSTHAFDINEHGQIVGASYIATGDRHAFLWDKGTMIDLGTMGGWLSDAQVINDNGQVAGTIVTYSEEWRAFLWNNGTMIDLGVHSPYYIIDVYQS